MCYHFCSNVDLSSEIKFQTFFRIIAYIFTPEQEEWKSNSKSILHETTFDTTFFPPFMSVRLSNLHPSLLSGAAFPDPESVTINSIRSKNVSQLKTNGLVPKEFKPIWPPPPKKKMTNELDQHLSSLLLTMHYLAIFRALSYQ